MVRSFYSRLGLVLLAVVVAQSAAKARTCAEVQAELARLRGGPLLAGQRRSQVGPKPTLKHGLKDR